LARGLSGGFRVLEPWQRGSGSLYGGGNPLTSLIKSGLEGLAVRLAFELRRSKVAAVAITPGFLRSESMLEHLGVTAEDWRAGGKDDPSFLESESPLFLGRAVAALAADKDVMRRSGAMLCSWEPGFVAETRLHLEFLERMAARALLPGRGRRGIAGVPGLRTRGRSRAVAREIHHG
jgi:NAD(P)-dependent dehydrogenase (short-subunit alcohol dehydrogenase family)